jgi:hypothetical protein
LWLLIVDHLLIVEHLPKIVLVLLPPNAGASLRIGRNQAGDGSGGLVTDWTGTLILRAFERQLPGIWCLSRCASCAKPWPENSGNGLMKAKVAGLVVVSAWLVGAAAWAQQTHVPTYREEEKEKSETEKAVARDAENAYKRSLGNIPEQKSADPWGTMRGDSTAPKTTDKTAADKAAAKAAHVKPKPKTDLKTAPMTDTATKQ